MLHFEVVGEESGFRFRHELPGGRMDNLPKATMGGFAVLDADGDGRMDLYMVNGGWHPDLAGAPRPERPAPNHLFRNLGDLRFEDVSAGSGVDDTGFGLGACIGDFDNDGAVDLFVSNYGGSRLYRGRGDGTFEDVTEAAGIAPGLHAGAAFVDYDRDGLLDLFVGQYVDTEQPVQGTMVHVDDGDVLPPVAFEPQPAFLYRNLGDGRFEDVTRAAGLVKPGRAMGVLATDLDDDGWMDLLVANDASANFAWRNRGDGTFEDAAAVLGLAFGMDARERGSMGVSSGDLDGDGRLDYFVPDTTGGCVYVAMKQWYADRAYDWGLVGHVRPLIGWADVPFDADNDGDLDVYKTHGDLRSLTAQDSFLLESVGDKAFERRPAGEADILACARSAVAVDLDDDGRLDLAVAVLEGHATLLANRTRDPGGFVRLRLEGRKSNRMALGARITGTVGGRPVIHEVSGSTAYASAGDVRAHFGLGTTGSLDDVRVRWPNGDVEDLGSLRAGSDVTVVEGQGVR
jgi:hypothetical protein